MAAGLPREPLTPSDGRKLICKILEERDVEFWHHAQEEMTKDGLSQVDCLNVLRGGWPAAGECYGNRWRYQVHTQAICVVVQFELESHLAVVTAWRKRERS